MDNQSDVAAKSLKDNKDTNDTSQNPDATQGLDKNPTKNVDFFKITPEQQQVAEAGHDKYVQLSAQ